MKRVNFFLRLWVLTLLFFCLYPLESSARYYVPAKKIGTKVNVKSKPTVSSRYKPDIPLSQQNRSTPIPTPAQQSSQNRYVPARESGPSYFQRKLAGPYISGGIGVQMNRHAGELTDGVGQTHEFNTNAQGFGLEVALGWIFSLPQYYFVGIEAGVQPIPLKTEVKISDATTTASIKGKLGGYVAGLFGRHFSGDSAIAYIKLGLEWRQFNVIHQVEDNVNDDTNENRVLFGFSPGVGIGFWVFNNLYMVGEFRTTFFQASKFKSPNGGRLILKDKYPRVDTFLIRFIMPLNQCLGTRLGYCS